MTARNASSGDTGGKRAVLETALLTGVALLAFFLYRGVGPLDDDFIVFRYARNLVEHGELTYNLGERVEGYTVPLWVFTIALVLRLGIDPVLATLVLGAATFVGTVLLAASFWRRARPGSFAWPALAIALFPAFAFHARGGLGTVPLAFLLLAWACLWQRDHALGQRATAAAFLLGAACLLRAECVLFVVPFVLGEAARARNVPGRRPWAALDLLVPALVPVLLWLGFRLYYYGEWLPNTYHAKHLALADELHYGWQYLRQSTIDSGIGLWLLFCVVAVLRLGSGCINRWLALSVLIHAAYVVAVGGDYIQMARFFVPTLPIMLLVGSHEVRRLGALPCALLLMPGLWSLGGWEAQREIYADNEGRWQAVGRELNRTTGATQRIAISPIGCVGYYSERPIVDILGLTHRAFWDVEPDPAVTLKGHQRHDADWVFRQAPEIIIPTNARMQPNTANPVLTWELDLLQHPDLARKYRPLLVPVEGSYSLVYYARLDLPVPTLGRVLPTR